MALIGKPTAVAEPATFGLLDNYKTWLEMERRFLCFEMARGDHAKSERYDALTHMNNAAGGFHWPETSQPSTRAALVLSAVGCDWRTDGR